MAGDSEAAPTAAVLGAVDFEAAVIAAVVLEVIGAATEGWADILTAAAMDSEAIVATGIAARDIGTALAGQADIHHRAALLAGGRDFPVVAAVTAPPADGGAPGAQGRCGRALLTVGGMLLASDAAPQWLA